MAASSIAANWRMMSVDLIELLPGLLSQQVWQEQYLVVWSQRADPRLHAAAADGGLADSNRLGVSVTTSLR
jgi:hypothetical protein